MTATHRRRPTRAALAAARRGHRRVLDDPPGIDPQSFAVPHPLIAAERVEAFVTQWGDGCIKRVDDGSMWHAPTRTFPLYARDVVSLAREAREADRLRTELAQLRAARPRETR